MTFNHGNGLSYTLKILGKKKTCRKGERMETAIETLIPTRSVQHLKPCAEHHHSCN